MIPTVKREFDGEWIEALLELKHKTTVDIRTIRKPYDAQLPTNVSPLELQKRFAAILTPADDSKMDDILILGQVKAWSFGEVTQKVLDDEISEPKRLAICAILGELYFPLAVADSGHLRSNTMLP